MEAWLGAVERCAGWDEALAGEVAGAAQLVKGYGDVRRRLVAVFDDLLAMVMRAAELEAAAGGDFRVAAGLAGRYHAVVLGGPEREAEARALARGVIQRLEARDRPAAAALLG